MQRLGQRVQWLGDKRCNGEKLQRLGPKRQVGQRGQGAKGEKVWGEGCKDWGQRGASGAKGVKGAKGYKGWGQSG